MQAPDPITLRYQISSSKGSGLGELIWQPKEDGTYTLSWQQNLGDKTQTLGSVGQLGNLGLHPLRYSEAGSQKSEVATHFVADKGQIIFSNNSPAASYSPGVQDPISVLLQLGGFLAAQNNLHQTGALLEIPVAGSSSARLWQFRVLGLQTVPEEMRANLGAKTSLQWLAVEHEPSRDGGPAWEPALTVWYDTEGYLPRRIQRRYADGQTQDAYFSSSESPL